MAEKATTYSVMRSHKLPPGSKPYHEVSPVAVGLSLAAARAEVEQLEREEDEAKPLQTSWTKDVFYLQREQD